MRDLPQVLTHREDADGVRLNCCVPEDCRWFAGHFPGFAILPGVVQLGWAVHYAKQVYAFSADPESYQRIKFMQPMLPGMHFALCLRRDDQRVSYQYLQEVSVASSGIMHFG